MNSWRRKKFIFLWHRTSSPSQSQSRLHRAGKVSSKIQPDHLDYDWNNESCFSNLEGLELRNRQKGKKKLPEIEQKQRQAEFPSHKAPCHPSFICESNLTTTTCGCYFPLFSSFLQFAFIQRFWVGKEEEEKVSQSQSRRGLGLLCRVTHRTVEVFIPFSRLSSLQLFVRNFPIHESF